MDYTSRRLYRYDFSDYVYEYGLTALLTFLFVVSLVVIIIMKNRSIHAAHEEKLRELIDKDKLTGVYSLDGFRNKASELIHDHP